MFRNIRLVYQKELLDTIRDRRTIISMIIVPILIFPLLTFGFSALIAGIMEKSKQEIHKIAVVNKQAAPELFEMIATSNKVQVVESDSVEAAILRKDIRAALIIPVEFKQKMASSAIDSLPVLYDASETKSRFAADRIEDILNEYRQKIVIARLAEKGLEESLVKPFEIKQQNVASKEKMGSFLLSIFLPYMILMLSLTGAMYTAMDLTAGEKERGTLETILVSPIPRWQLATGKFLTILTTSIVTTILAITSLTATMAYSISAGGAIGGEMALKIAPSAIFVIFLMMIPTASLFSAVLMAISLSAKSFKEAQSYVTPFMMVVILPSLVSFIPGIDLNIGLAFIPLANICLSIKEALLGNINWLYISIIFLSTALYAAFAIFVAHRLFEKESILFSN